MKKHRALLLLSLTGMLMVASPVLPASAEWKTTKAGTMYTQEAAPGYVVGWMTLKKKTYYFNSKGIMLTGLQTIDKKKYCFDKDGALLKGWIELANGKKCYSNKSTGVIVTDKWVNDCYLQSDGIMAVNKWINGKWVGADGKFTGLTRKVGWITENGTTRYYTSTGKMVTGWLNTGGKTYYLQSGSGVLLKGWITVSGKTYFASKTDGSIQKGKWVDNKYLKNNGVMATGWLTVDDKTYLLDNNGNKTKGWITYQKRVYYFSKKGVMVKDKWVDNKYLTSNGVRASGFLTIEGNTYYLDPSTGNRTVGWLALNNKRYYFGKKKNELGILYKSKWIGSKKCYYASSSGAIVSGLNTINNYLYYFNPTNQKKVKKTLQTVGSATYYFNKKGKAVKNKWVKIKDNYYYFQNDYKMAKNTFIGEYYVNGLGIRTSGVTKKAGWQTVDGKKYYFDKDGNVIIGWKTIKGNKYYFGPDGAMVTGIQTIGTRKYYFYSDGRLATSLSIIIGSKKYTINSNGVVTKEESLKVPENTRGDSIVNYAIKFIGNPYVYGGTSLTKGADCSGFVYSVFAHFKINLLRVADDQRKGPSSDQIKKGYKQATQVDINSILPGDLLFYGSKGYASHVGIYIGKGEIVHASNSQPYPKGGIKISNYDYSQPIAAVRYW